MVKRLLLMLIAVGVVLGGVFGFDAFRAVMIKKFLATLGSRPQTVSTTKAVYSDWQPKIEAIGTLRAVNGADLSAQVAGIVTGIHFHSGDDVKKGTALVDLLDSADVAKLDALKASAALARITYERDLRQLKVQAVSRQQVDTDQQNLKSAEAQVAEQQAAVDYKHITAPFAGHLGIRQVDLGQYLSPGAPIVTLQALNPLYVDFYVPQQQVSEIKLGQAVTARVDTYPGRTFSGRISAINPAVQVSTRNVEVRAEIANPDKTLLPGMYATVDIVTGTPQRFITLPQTAITYNPYGSTVFLVESKGKTTAGKPILIAHQTFVTTGAKRGDQVQLLKGVSAGDIVVSAGQIKLHNGSPIVVNNSVLPTNDRNPTPSEE